MSKLNPTVMLVFFFIFCGFGGFGTTSFTLKVLDSIETNPIIKSVTMLVTFAFIFITASWIGDAVGMKLYYDTIVQQTENENKNKDSVDNS